MCVRMNSFHVVVVLRSGAGGRPWRLRMLPTVWSLIGVAQVGQGPDDAVIAPGAILLGHADNQGLQLRVYLGTAWGLALLGAVKFLGHELAVPGENGVGLDDGGDFLEGLLAQLLADLSQRLALAVRSAAHAL